jgi:MoxR-like ATPase
MAGTSPAITIKLSEMDKPSPHPLPASIDATVDLLAEAQYLADRSLGTVLYLALRMGRPLFLEGEAGVGKTEIAKVLAHSSAML